MQEHKKKILITGASGFIGMATIREIAKDPQWDIYAIISGQREVKLPIEVNIIKTNLLTQGNVEDLIFKVKPDTLMHFAWKMTGRGDRFRTTNLDWLEISLRILKAFVANKGKRFLFAGSSAEYGGDGNNPSDCYNGSTENGFEMPTDLYGECKRAFGSIAARVCATAGIEYVHPRIFSVYGPGEISLHATATSIDYMLHGKTFVCKAPNNLWDFVYIDDVARDLAILAAGNFTGVINISGGIPIQASKFFRLIAKAAEREDLLEFENKDQPGMVLYGNTDMMNKILKNPYRTPIEEGIRQAVTWRKGLLEGVNHEI